MLIGTPQKSLLRKLGQSVRQTVDVLASHHQRRQPAQRGEQAERDNN